MKTIQKIAVAASVLVAASALFAWLALGSQSLAFADMAKAFAGVRTARFTVITTIEGTSIPPQETKCLFMAPARERLEMRRIEVKKDGGTNKIPGPAMIFDWEKKKALSLIPRQKLAITIDLGKPPKSGQTSATFVPDNTFDNLRKKIQQAQRGEKNTESLGERTIDGKTAIGFRISEGNLVTKIWADPKTELPMLVEIKCSIELGGSDGMVVFSPVRPSDNVSKTVMKDFEYDVELNKSLFDLTPPEGYTVRKQSVYISQPSIEILTEGLRFYAENNDGMFPKKLLGKEGIEGAMEETARRNVAKYGDDLSKIDTATMKKMKILGRVVLIVKDLPSKDHYHYAGAGVKLGDAEKAIFWLKPKGSETYQVLYGDLRVVEGVDEKDLPRVP